MGNAEMQRNWDVACHAYEKATREMRAYERDYLNPASERFQQWRGKWPIALSKAEEAAMEADAGRADALARFKPVSDHYEAMVGIQYSALIALIRTPAPDVQAVTYKLEAMHKEEIFEDGSTSGLVASLLADLHRLAGHPAVERAATLATQERGQS